MSRIKKVIAIFGMPRSGTSFLGQIFDSSPQVAYRLEPIFSYKLKNMVNDKSTKEDFLAFFEKAFDSHDDDFMNQTEKRKKGHYPVFQKTKEDVLVFKTTRFHNLLPNLMELFDEDFLQVISLVRHPAGAISSWVTHPNEFPSNFDYKEEWRSGSCRKSSVEEFWGFEDWKDVTSQHLNLENKYRNFHIFQYEDIVNNITDETKKIFDFSKIPYTRQTEDFLIKSQDKHIDDPYAVYKDKSVTLKWKKNLDKYIQKQIIDETKQSQLKRFLVEK